MRAPSGLTWLPVFALAALAGCKARPIPGSAADVVTVPTGDPTGGGGGPIETLLVTNCTPCHGTGAFRPAAGDPLVAAAPPLDTHGNTLGPAVGAHRAHLVDGPMGRAVECASCHLVPTESIPGHPAQQQGKLTFSRVATATFDATRAQPVWDPAARTCSGVYCHGAFKNGANNGQGATPAWNGGSVPCGSCHALPPPAPHPAGAAECGTCHGAGYGSTTVDATLHVNGVLDLGAMTCASCHGDATRAPVASAGALDADGAPLVLAAPPRDHLGATTSAAVGAHLAHVNQGDGRAPGPLSLAVSCDTCHPVPVSKGHSSGSVDVAFTGLARAGGATPAAYDLGAHTCASTYCHGAFPGGLGANALSWTGAAKLGCAGCHLSPPPANATAHHPPNPACATCHPGYSASTVNVATHVDGAAQHQPATGCTQCHGDVTASGVSSADVRAAPAGNAAAIDAHGNAPATTSARGIGAHARHLTGTTFRGTPIACAECHAVPASGDVAHADGVPTLTWGALATRAWSGGAVAPSWNGATCSGTYCHGNFKNGANAAPTWAAPSAVSCGSCHGVSTVNGPGGNHPTGVGADCASCHGGVYTSAQVDPTRHLNGSLDLLDMACTSCHGDVTRLPVAGAGATDVDDNPLVRASPPRDASGVTVSTAVGAHLAHVNQGDTAAPGPLSLPVACVTCHTVPAVKVHSNDVADVTFTSLAVAAGATPAPYDGAGHSCSGTYCHGGFQGGLGANPIAWSTAGKLACTSCHAAPPATASSHHPPNAACGTCHPGYGASAVVVATHVDGLVQHTPASGCTQCHGDVTVSGVANTDLRVAPAGGANAIDAHGNPATATGAAGVGAHARHLTSTAFRGAPLACADCHVLPAPGDVAHANGAADVPFGALARSVISGTAPSPSYAGNTCSNVYCHGAFTNGANGGAGASVTWAAASPTPMACGSCHGVSAANGPGGTHPNISGLGCGVCHGSGYSADGAGTVNLTFHLNGRLDGGGEPTSPGTSCGGCHSAIVTAMTSATAPASRHLLGGDIPADSGVAWVGTLANVAVGDRSCVSMCHGDHPHDATSPVTTTHQNNVYFDASSATSRANASPTRVAAGGSGAQNRDATDFRGGATSGGLCMSCHTRPVDAARPALAIAAFDASAHDFTFNTVSGTRLTWQYALHSGSFDRNCTKCHASATEGNTPRASTYQSVHSGDNALLLAGKKNPGGVALAFVCYNCHGSTASPAAGAQGDRSGKRIQPQIGKTANHPSHADSRHDSVAEFNAASFGNALGVSAGAGQRHASCLDCHDAHEARAGTHAQGSNTAGPPLQGAWGAQYVGSIAEWSTPTDAIFVKKTIVAGTDLEATLCFKCHSAYYGTLPSSPSGGFQETDQAREFNPNNRSFHPVLGSASANLGATSNVINGWTRTSLMTCTDCHESDQTTDPSGPHGSAAAFLLKGPNTTWNNTIATGSGGMPAGTFCSNCHAASFANSRFDRHTRNDHWIACTNCHARVPHGGRRPGLLVNTNGTAGGCSPTGGTLVGWDDSPIYRTPGTGSLLCVRSYPANNTSTWARSNCGCDGSSH